MITPLSSQQIRDKFVAFFTQKLASLGKPHTHVPSASLIPVNNPTVMLTPAGMLPFVPYFLGLQSPPEPPRLLSIQKCARVSGKASDLDSVGRTRGHHTLFEMLGNFSFGDYFKTEMIPWAWTFLTEDLGLPAERLLVSVFETDDEAFNIWTQQVGVPASRVVRCGEKDNFWGPPGPTGPCGPCSEIYFDFGDLDALDTPDTPDTPDAPYTPESGEINLDQPRYLEVWNLVFMEYFQDAQGHRTPLAQKNVDTGMGLERISLVLQGAKNTFETDLFLPLIHQLAQRVGVAYGQSPQTDTALKIVADHTRFLVLALADGVTPSNEGRGYIARMILRRASRFARRVLGCQTPLLAEFAERVAAHLSPAYPELMAAMPKVAPVIAREEARFNETLERGEKHLEALIDACKNAGEQTIAGEDAFKLYDTYGFPLEMTQDAVAEFGLSVDADGFAAAMAAQKTRARGARKATAMVESPVYAELSETLPETRFVGYDTLTCKTQVLALLLDGEPVDEVSGTNTPFEAVLAETPFYAESGGQVGDRGTFIRDEGHHGLTVVVEDAQKVGDLVIHKCLFDNGTSLRVGESLVAQVEPVARHAAAVHHTATHLLNAALKQVLGADVAQAGSRVAPEGARFDFTAAAALTPVQLAKVEWLMNHWIQSDPVRDVQVMPIAQAQAEGAVMMAGEKYGDSVRVVRYGLFSHELCGGTHLERLGYIGLAKIVSESAIAAGVRRIEMLAGEAALRYVRQESAELSRIADLLKAPKSALSERIEKLQDDLKLARRQTETLTASLARQQLEALLTKSGAGSGDSPETPKLLVAELSPDLPNAGDLLKLMSEAAALVMGRHYALFLALAQQDRVQFACAISESVVKARGWKAGELVKQAAQLCDGGGGGKPTLAQAGGKNASALPQAMAQIRAVLCP
ncbi:MAG: alanine--tRNA ligase [Vampirovibrionales bacterium]|nr:alanine--tRNA ligase [Vampirovibrionales bacterium]